MAAALNLQGLRALLQQHLTAALDELFGNLQKTFTEYEQELSRQRRLLDLLTATRSLNPAESSDLRPELQTERRALISAQRYGPSPDLLTERRAQNQTERRVPSQGESVHSAPADPRTSPGSEAICTVTVKTEEQVSDQPLTQDPPQDERLIKEEASRENEMELDPEMVLDYDPLMLLLPDSEDPREAGDPGPNQDPATTERTTSEMASSSKTSHYWTDEETGFMLAKLKEFEIIKCLDGRKKRNGNIFKRVSCALAKAGYERTAEQIRVRWKNVKKAYYDVQRLNEKIGYTRESCPHMDILEDLLAEGATTQGAEKGVESDPKTGAAPEPRVDTPPQSSLVSADETGDTTPAPVRVQLRDTSTPNVSSPKPTPRKRSLSPTTALDSYFQRLDNHQKDNAQRHRENMKLRERTHRENKALLVDLVETNKVLVDTMMGMIRQPPSTAPTPQTLNGQPSQEDFCPVYRKL